MHKIYATPGAELWLEEYKGTFWLSLRLSSKPRLSLLRLGQEVLLDLELSLRDKGLTEIFVLVRNKTNKRFAEFFGFESTGLIINSKFEVLRKGL